MRAARRARWRESTHPPDQPSSFTGPTLNIGVHESNLNNTAPNTGKLEDFFVYGSQVAGGFDYHSQGFCGLYDSFVYDPLTLNNTDLDYCNGGLTPDNGTPPQGLQSPGEQAATRSELESEARTPTSPAVLPYSAISLG